MDSSQTLNFGASSSSLKESGLYKFDLEAFESMMAVYQTTEAPSRSWKHVSELPFKNVATARLHVENREPHMGLFIRQDVSWLERELDMNFGNASIQEIRDIYPDAFSAGRMSQKLQLSRFFPTLISPEIKSRIDELSNLDRDLLLDALELHVSGSGNGRLIHRTGLLRTIKMIDSLGLYRKETTVSEISEIDFELYARICMGDSSLCSGSLFSEIQLLPRVYNENKRLFQYSKLPPNRILLLEEIYDARFPDLIRLPVFAFERYIIEVTRENHLLFASQIGMIIPLTYKDISYDYYLSNITKYRNVFSGMERADGGIFGMAGVFFSYNSRENLIETMRRFSTSPAWIGVFSPLEDSTTGKPFYNLLDRSINKELTTGETPLEAFQDKEFVICFGNNNAFHTTTLEELDNAFVNDDLDAIFRKPYDYGNEFSDTEINKLVNHLKMYPPTPQITSLLNKIESIQSSQREKTEKEKQRLIKLREASPEIRSQIRDFYMTVFEIGMYFRRWKGPGNPYPVASSTTQSKDIDPTEDETTARHIEKLDFISKALPNVWKSWLKKTPLYQADRYNKFSATSYDFGEYHRRVLTDKECIRMASSKYVATGARGLLVYFREQIPGFDVASVDHIQ